MTGNPLPPPGSTLQERIAALPENLRGLAQNDYMIDEGMLPDGHMLNDAADRIEDLEAEVERLTARVTELEGDPRMAFTGQHYCDLRNFISDARARWEPHLGAEYMDDLDELVRQALIAHRAALAAEGKDKT